jgi:formylglycine-generating enzyme required for sulfatase activity
MFPGMKRFSATFVVAAFAAAAVSVTSLRAAEPHIIRDLGLKLMSIPAGTFTMGSPATEAVRQNNEGPRTQVTISRPFWLGQTEVTHAQWRKIMGTDLVEQARRMLTNDATYTIAGKKQTIREFYKKTRDSDPKELVFNADDNAPMYWVSWDDAVEFCRRLNAREGAAGRLPKGHEYRLPTESEWEYACRAGTKQATYAGELEIKGKNNVPALDDIAWYAGNSSAGYIGKGQDTADWPEKQYPSGIAAQRTVGTKRPNPWGLHDMIGNLGEWCGDWYADKLPGGDVRDPRGPASGPGRILRGGSWDDSALRCRAALPSWASPGPRNTRGFRIALAPRVST